ncbi:MAG: hypothetical protein L6V93_14905 [Clostridiales bacterium]|nr:MAG: hypothetical protein L6V93_14905 [Clostridiales bacterium]
MNIDYDLYVDKKDSSGRKTMVLRLSNDKDTNIVRFTNSEMKLLNNLVTEYSEGQWYHFSVKADTVQNTVSVFVNGVPYFCKSMLNSSNSDGNQSLKLLRLYGPGEENAGFTAIDNIKVTGFLRLAGRDRFNRGERQKFTQSFRRVFCRQYRYKHCLH